MKVRVDWFHDNNDEGEVYGEESIKDLLDNDSITAAEEAFMNGYNDALEEGAVLLDDLSPDEESLLHHRRAERGVLGE